TGPRTNLSRGRMIATPPNRRPGSVNFAGRFLTLTALCMQNDRPCSCPGPSGGWPGPPTSRRRFLERAGGGLGLIALATLLQEQGLLARDAPAPVASPLAPKPPHFAPRAQRVIFLFMSGGPSHVDLFDPKPELI